MMGRKQGYVKVVGMLIELIGNNKERSEWWDTNGSGWSMKDINEESPSGRTKKINEDS